MQDVDPVDAVELTNSVTELKQWDVVHCHPEGVCAAQDLHLKGAPQGKGEGSFEVSLFRAPALAQFVISDHHLFPSLIEAGINVKRNVVSSEEVHCEHFTIRLHVAQDGHHHFVIHTSGQV